MSKLLSINVNEHTEKKGGLSYLSWAWAWAEVLKIDPAATWVAHQYGPQGSEQPCMWIGETAMVHTSVTINGTRRECMLPVMDNRNNAVKMPDARKISDAIMRCMTKAIAMHGLGLYIYAGEDLPEDDIDNDPKPFARAAAKPRLKDRGTDGEPNPAHDHEPKHISNGTPVAVYGMSPNILADWLTIIGECEPDNLESVVRDGLAAATEVKDREAFVSIRQAGKIRTEKLTAKAA